jgi:hypothetical protein
MDSDAFNYVVYALTLVAVAGSAVTIYRMFWSGRGKKKVRSPEGASM